MKACAQKNSNKTATPAIQTASQPFFKKAGENNFFSPARPAVVTAIHPNVAVNRPGGKFVLEAPAAEKRPLRTNEEGTPGRDKGDEPSLPTETQTPSVRPDRSPDQTATAGKPSEENHPAQPAAGRVDSQTPGPPGSGQKNEEEGTDGTAPQGSEIPTGAKTANEGDHSALSGRIAAAPPSPAKAQAVAQAQLISSDCMRSEAKVSQIAAARRRQTNTFFSGARQDLTGFFTRSVVAVQTFIANKQADIIAAVTRTLAWIRTAITGTLQAAQSLAGQIRTRINRMLESIATSVQGRVVVIGGQITGLIDSIPLPDIPGMGQIRAAAVSLLNRAAGVVNKAFGRFVGFIGGAFNAGMSALDAILSAIARFADRALSLASSAIQGVMQIIAQAINRALFVILSTLRRVLLAILIPILSRVERLITGLIGFVEQRAIGLLRTNRDKYLSSLAEALSPRSPASRPAAASTESPAAVIQQLGRDAIQTSRLIVQTLESAIGGAITAIIRTVASEAIRIVTAITGLIAQSIQAILAAFTQGIQMLAQLVQTMGNFLRDLIRALTAAVEKPVEYIRSLVQRGADQLLQFAQNGLRQINSFIRRFVQNLIHGRGISDSLTGSIGEFSIANDPITIPYSESSFTAYDVPKPLVIVLLVLVALALLPILGVIILPIILFFLLMYLLFRPRPVPAPAPPPEPPKITHRTKSKAPDGSPESREIIGVGERVDFAGPEEVWGTDSMHQKWSISSGSPKDASGRRFTWTAPDRAEKDVKIELTVGSQNASVLMHVVEPEDKITATNKKKLTYPAGKQGAGMKLTFILHPQNVSFGNIKTKEVSGPATDIWGFFTDKTKYLNVAGEVKNKVSIWHNSKDTFYLIGEDNKDTEEDTAEYKNVPPPWKDGGFTWKIPNHFRTITEGGDGKRFATVDQVTKVEANSGRTTITKAGQSVP
jgi:hypothetical protein